MEESRSRPLLLIIFTFRAVKITSRLMKIVDSSGSAILRLYVLLAVNIQYSTDFLFPAKVF